MTTCFHNSVGAFVSAIHGLCSKGMFGFAAALYLRHGTPLWMCITNQFTSPSQLHSNTSQRAISPLWNTLSTMPTRGHQPQSDRCASSCVHSPVDNKDSRQCLQPHLKNVQTAVTANNRRHRCSRDVPDNRNSLQNLFDRTFCLLFTARALCPGPTDQCWFEMWSCFPVHVLQYSRTSIVAFFLIPCSHSRCCQNYNSVSHAPELLSSFPIRLLSQWHVWRQISCKFKFSVAGCSQIQLRDNSEYLGDDPGFQHEQISSISSWMITDGHFHTPFEFEISTIVKQKSVSPSLLQICSSASEILPDLKVALVFSSLSFRFSTEHSSVLRETQQSFIRSYMSMSFGNKHWLHRSMLYWRPQTRLNGFCRGVANQLWIRDILTYPHPRELTSQHPRFKGFGKGAYGPFLQTCLQPLPLLFRDNIDNLAARQHNRFLSRFLQVKSHSDRMSFQANERCNRSKRRR